MNRDQINSNSKPITSKNNLTDRQKRLSEALRENLRKRKSQSSQRIIQSDPTDKQE